MDEARRHRYARHITLPEIGESGQARLGDAAVLLVGLGGLGCAAAQYLNAAGVGTLILNDFDRVDASNLQRQVLHGEADIGHPKTASAAAALSLLREDVSLEMIDQRLDEAALISLLGRCDAVVDGSDNFGTRFSVNRAAVATGTPLISGAAIRWQGQLAVFDSTVPDSPCYACLFAEADEAMEDCAGQGVLAPLVGVIGAAMAVACTRALLGIHAGSLGELWRYDALAGSWVRSRFGRDPACQVCTA